MITSMTTQPTANPYARLLSGAFDPAVRFTAGRNRAWAALSGAVGTVVSPVRKGAISGVRAWSPPV